ncbi:MAG: alpha/beta fold hydrolase [Oscillospiraceae bacterium]|nr:alpha/beta fold hydrolase [Oscillospiraceae bacterium]
MEITLKRDGLTLRGDLIKPETEKCPIAIIFHGLMANRNAEMFTSIADALLEKGLASVRFDFDGHGESDGDFSDMTVYSEVLDAAKIIDYVKELDFVTDIYIVGHSQGALVGGMIAGYYREYVSKLAMLAPAATIKDDAQVGNCFGKKYDTFNTPEHIELFNHEKERFLLDDVYMRIARTLPVYETTSMFRGKTLIIHGENDEAVGVIGAKRYAECMDNVTLNIIENETHGLDTISLENVVTQVAEFLSE